MHSNYARFLPPSDHSCPVILTGAESAGPIADIGRTIVCWRTSRGLLEFGVELDSGPENDAQGIPPDRRHQWLGGDSKQVVYFDNAGQVH